MGKGVGVAWEALPAATDFETVRADVERHLPLRNLHWVRKSAANRTIRTIQTLPVQVRPRETFQGATDLLDMPYLSMLFVVCDARLRTLTPRQLDWILTLGLSQDNEVYRATLRTQIREWLDSITAKRHQEWLIVHVTTGRGTGGKFYQRKGTVVDKIKADFNTGKRDRCIQVIQGASAEDPTAWADFLTKMKECIVTTFDANVTLYEENIRKADSQRMLAGWQFLPFCRQKEALADSFEAMTLFEDSLIQYDELEASFFQHVKEHSNAPWLERFGGLSRGDDAIPLLSTSSKPYRKLIDMNQITVFDFRVYLFARQAFMLFHLDRVVEVARRGAYFVSTFARKLRENQATLGPNFVESWTYSACLDIVAACEAKVSAQPNPAPSVALVAVKAELLELLKKQLDKLGILAGHLPPQHPFTMSLNESSPASVAPSPTASQLDAPAQSPVTRQDLLDAIEQREVFDRLYADSTHRAMHAYNSAGRRRCAAKLHACLGALEQERGRNAAAQKLLSGLSAQYTEQRWSCVEAYLHSRSAELQASLNMPRDQLLSTLALVRAGVPPHAKEWALDAVLDETAGKLERNEDLARRLMADVHALSGALTKDFAAVAFPTFSISLEESTGGRPADEDGVTAVALIRSLLPCDLRVDEVRLKFATDEGEQVWLTTGACTLRANASTPATVFCPTSISGRLTLELSQLRFSRIIFQYSHRARPDDHLALPPRQRQSTVLVPDPEAVSVTLEEPREVHLDRRREAIVCVDTGRNEILRISLRLSVEEQDVSLLSKFSVTTDGTKGLIIKSAEMQAPGSVTVQPCRKDWSRPVIVSPVQTANFLFKLTCQDPTAVEEPLRLVLTYVSTEQRIRARVRRVVQDALRDNRWRSARRWTFDTVLADALSSFSTGTAEDGRPFDEILWKERIESRFSPAGATAALIPVLKEIDQALQKASPDTDSSEQWYTLEIPLDLPALSVLNLVSVEPDAERVELGERFAAAVELKPTCRWDSRPEDQRSPLQLAYTVVYDHHNWAVTGPLQGQVTLSAGETSEFQLELAALRTGMLFLPSLAVHATAASSSSAESSPISGETQHVTAARTVEVLPGKPRMPMKLSQAYMETYAV
ncbi:hypothetical protein JCM8202v2_004489 [Rhodotorula sphaerocarpa]